TKALFLVLSVVLSFGLFACSQQASQQDPFMQQWRTLADTAHGYSPAVEDLKPEPRVLMHHQEQQDTPPKALPSLPVTLKLHNVDVGVALRSLAAAAGVNILLGTGIAGTVNINVQKTPWSDVFLGLLNANSLSFRWQGALLQVATLAEKKREVELLTLNNQLATQRLLGRQNAPLSLCVVNVRYAEALALQKVLVRLLSTTESQSGQTATVEVDEHSNALILQGTETDLHRLVSLVENLDRPRSQVQLKAYIVEATKESARELGTEWGGIWKASSVFEGEGDFNYTPNSTDNMGSLGLRFGKAGGNRLEVQLHLMEKAGQVDILSSPSITTLDNKMAYTENGQVVPYVSTSNMGDREVRFEKAMLRLEMTPNVIDGDNLKLKIMVRKDEVDTSRNVDGNPFIIKKQTETTLIMRNNETVVISGLTKEKSANTNAGIPGLKELPGGSVAFGHESTSSLMEEVLIFITPQILPIRAPRVAPEASAQQPEPSQQRVVPAPPAPEADLAHRKLEDLTDSDLGRLGLRE
ncbi:MAG: secretin N-terminal domain-containing protein, partial [Bilophila sp.]